MTSAATRFIWLLPLACSSGGEGLSWSPFPKNSDGGDLAWSANGALAALGETVALSVALELSATECEESQQSCTYEEPVCTTYERRGVVDPKSVVCEGAGCSVRAVANQNGTVDVFVQASRAGLVHLSAKARDPETDQVFSGAAHLEFIEADEIVWMRQPLAAPGTASAVLVGSAFQWCVEVRGPGANGNRVRLLATPALASSPELGIDDDERNMKGYGSDAPGCVQLRALATGSARLDASFAALTKSVAFEIVSTDAVVAATIRSFSGAPNALRGWLPVEEELVEGFSAPLESLSLGAGLRSGLLVTTLEFDDGKQGPGGVGALTVGPSGVVTLSDVVMRTSGVLAGVEFAPAFLDSDAPLVTRSLFSVRRHMAGDGELRLELGAADLRLPIVGAALPDGGAGGEAGAGEGGASGASEGGASGERAEGGSP